MSFISAFGYSSCTLSIKYPIHYEVIQRETSHDPPHECRIGEGVPPVSNAATRNGDCNSRAEED